MMSLLQVAWAGPWWQDLLAILLPFFVKLCSKEPTEIPWDTIIVWLILIYFVDFHVPIFHGCHLAGRLLLLFDIRIWVFSGLTTFEGVDADATFVGTSCAVFMRVMSVPNPFRCHHSIHSHPQACPSSIALCQNSLRSSCLPSLLWFSFLRWDQLGYWNSCRADGSAFRGHQHSCFNNLSFL